MKNICFITQCSLPIPTTKGGAVETLVEYILDENEKNAHYNITVISIGDERAEEKAKRYKYTKFIYIEKANHMFNNLLGIAYRILKHLNIYIPFSIEFIDCMRELKRLQKQDMYIYEAGPTTQLLLLNRIIPQNKLLVHLHWDGMGTKKQNECFKSLIAISDYIGGRWKSATGCKDDKVKEFYNCANIERFQRDSSEDEKITLKQQLGIPLNNKVLIFTGRIVKDKGVRELLRSFELIKRTDISLIVIGSANFGAKSNTSYEKEVAELIKNSNKNIVFTGYVHQTELYKYYNIADISIMPSLFQEPAGLVAIEAQATGTPLIATNVGGLGEYTNPEGTVLIEKDDKLVYNLANAIEDLLDDEKKLAIMSISNKEFAKKFNTKWYFDKFVNIVDEAIKEN